MYMCRETIRRAVLQKFNESLIEEGDQRSGGVESYQSIDELYSDIGRGRLFSFERANAIINSLKICDPAVGSGHFLVSALNELIAIKSELEILIDKDGKPLRDCTFEVINDELIVKLDDELFQYNPKNPTSQRIQETIFHEKQTIIENCLFGVDINPNSVKICRLRLWIELLKHAYYLSPAGGGGEAGGGQLETLPNIDINIKCGNSLISRFGLDEDLSGILKSVKWDIEAYRGFVRDYKHASNKEEKKGLEKLIEQIKGDFKTEIDKKDKRIIRKNRLEGELFNLTQANLFEETQAQKKKRLAQIAKKEKEFNKLATEIEEIKSSKIFENAFEWRFAFPEVLDDNGDFLGFDVVIGNPPYIRIQDLNSLDGVVEYYKTSYVSGRKGNYDIYVLFIELGIQLAKNETGQQTWILPHKFINSSYGEGIRKLISQEEKLVSLVHFGAEQVFEDATTYTCLLSLSNCRNGLFELNLVHDLNFWKSPEGKVLESVPSEAVSSDEWHLMPENELSLLEKLRDDSKILSELTERIYQGLKTSADPIFIVKLVKKLENGNLIIHCPQNSKEYEVEPGLFHELIKGGDGKRYFFKNTGLKILFPYENGKILKNEAIESQSPLTWSYLLEHKDYLENRERGRFKGDFWFQFGRNQAVEIIYSPKIFTPDISPAPSFAFDNLGNKFFTGGVSGGYGIVPIELKDNHYLLAILNSKVTNWYITKTSTQMRGGWYSFESRFIKSIPIKSASDNRKKKIESKVDQILSLKKENPQADTSALEAEIDQMVYELYGLSEEEIKIVEGEN
ncbi:Eco57I restriction-modification methylase domain-containing protein [Roseivirga pacifica]|uniref:Eco57I restriction-modification methylase domain-containing protein n=1 Tax=Roseivirga pacifica TaxID=1267423 RepID=UPI003B8A7077